MCNLFLRDISKYMKEHNVEGSSRNYIPRVVSSYDSVSVEMVRKYFSSTLKFCHLYMEGENAFTVNKKMAELRKMKKCHRGAVTLEVDHSKKAYNRMRM